LKFNACYTKTFLEDGKQIISTFKKLKLDGANVTVPHKEYAFDLCDETKGIADKIGAVNTLVKESGKIVGYNTDAPGFFESIKSFSNINNALILGAGGTSKAIAFILNDHDIRTTILNRTEQRLGFFKSNGFDVFTWKDFKTDNYDLIINTTPAGLKDENLPLDKELLDCLMKKSYYAFDVIYGRITPFIKLAQKNYLICKDGSDMLLFQAVFAFNLFYKNQLKRDEIEKEMRKVFTL